MPPYLQGFCSGLALSAELGIILSLSKDEYIEEKSEAHAHTGFPLIAFVHLVNESWTLYRIESIR